MRNTGECIFHVNVFYQYFYTYLNFLMVASFGIMVLWLIYRLVQINSKTFQKYLLKGMYLVFFFFNSCLCDMLMWPQLLFRFNLTHWLLESIGNGPWNLLCNFTLWFYGNVLTSTKHAALRIRWLSWGIFQDQNCLNTFNT